MAGESGGASASVHLAPTPVGLGASAAPGASISEASLGNVSESWPASGTGSVTSSVCSTPAPSVYVTVVV